MCLKDNIILIILIWWKTIRKPCNASWVDVWSSTSG